MQIRTTEGLVEGIKCDGYTVYKGIPYAAPPVGNLRWKAPQPPAEYEGVYRADHFGNICWQTLPKEDQPIMGRFVKEFYGYPEFIPEMSEDCLYLNIWVPDGADGTNPVGFYIHGGGFGGGYSSEIEFDGEEYCRRGVILVTINYRLNLFGFLALPELSKESEWGGSGNYGILDQIAALKWVSNNISAFGGDPRSITVFGQSAGSMSTQVLVSSPLTDGLISKAVFQSGLACGESFLACPTLQEEESYGEMLLELSGAKTVEELRTLPGEEILRLNGELGAKLWQTLGNGMVIVPCVDGYVLPESVKECYANGHMRQIPYMLGTVIDDLGSTPENIAADEPGLTHTENLRWSLRIREVYGGKAWNYFFKRKLPGDDWGAFHSAELWYTFGTLKRCWRPMEERDYALSREMLDAWTSFMKTGDPNGGACEGWRPYTDEDPYVRVFE